MIEHQMEAFRKAGIRDITIVTGYGAEHLRYPGVKNYLNDDFRSNNILRSLMYAGAELDDDVLIAYSDIVFDQEIVDRLVRAPGDFVLVSDLDWRKAYEGRARAVRRLPLE